MKSDGEADCRGDDGHRLGRDWRDKMTIGGVKTMRVKDLDLRETKSNDD